ncbi:YbhB/YbcL family Raf kinase inhibitor-like protein [Halorientalis litorea]|jgi:Raf kinase inhibitor-like YbhB/YbcL family protein|uniref:YbhB/YbcL family Raf kinase inhibitor-like protein n=1 Tax=Halorientalis litorea TaxID=2931977 RepID=UPI001FF23910|nr:YbhB/YbcL family Raf kinase inhibitor-like protein [Halorientalis litorea]
MPTRRAVFGCVTGALCTLAGCTTLDGGDGVDTADPATTVDSGSDTRLTSSAFANGETIPTKHTGDGADVSPPLSLAGVPGAIASLALVVDDPDAPDGTFVHWLLWGLPPETREIPEHVPQARRVPSLGDARQGTNGFGELGYRGPRPPEGDGPHTYRFTLYALDSTVNVQAGARRRALSNAMAESVVATARLTGTYER